MSTMPWMKVERLPYLEPLQTTVLHQGRNYGHFGFGGWRSEEHSLLSWISYWGRCSTVKFRLKLKAWSSNSKGHYQILFSCVQSVSVRDNPFTCTSTAELRSTVRSFSYEQRNKEEGGFYLIIFPICWLHNKTTTQSTKLHPLDNYIHI